MPIFRINFRCIVILKSKKWGLKNNGKDDPAGG
jgi:hypothetical protein